MESLKDLNKITLVGHRSSGKSCSSEQMVPRLARVFFWSQ